MNPSWPLPQVDLRKQRADLEQIERWTRETAWENEGGATIDGQRATAAQTVGLAANDNGADAP